jgi:lysozyme family protein
VVSKFDRAFEAVLGHEGGYVNDPRDAGGETKYGISKRSYPHLNIAALTLDDAKAIYKRDFWDRAQADELPYRVGFQLFDGAVNSGVSQSVKWLQRAVGVADDGILGPVTLAAALAVRNSHKLVALYNAERLESLTTFGGWPTYSRGWSRRVASNLRV